MGRGFELKPARPKPNPGPSPKLRSLNWKGKMGNEADIHEQQKALVLRGQV